MNKACVAELFVEDHAHELFIGALVRRCARELAIPSLEMRIISARGGHPKALEEFKTHQARLLTPQWPKPKPDMLVIAIDANCSGWANKRKSIEHVIAPTLKPITVIACPEPHIERWYMADPVSFRQVVGKEPKREARKCDRDRYKSLLANAIVEAGHPQMLGGIEFAQELVEAMDLYRAGKAERSLKATIEKLRDLLNASKNITPK